MSSISSQTHAWADDTVVSGASVPRHYYYYPRHQPHPQYYQYHHRHQPPPPPPPPPPPHHHLPYPPHHHPLAFQPQPQHHNQLYYDGPDRPAPYRDMTHYSSAGATFTPGGSDGYYMPSQTPVLVAPAPQRHMPEMSDHIQEGIANLNINGRSSTVGATSPWSSPGLSPNFDSAFPAIHDRANRYPNVALSDDEVEKTLEEARMPVLTSNDPEMQLAWAQDALLYTTTAKENEERLQATQPPRPATPPVELQIRVDAMNVVTFLADQHHPQAEFMKGQWFEAGRFGVAQDKKEAFRCYSRAADRGYARAEYRIGMLYEASSDHQKALRHYLRGVESGDSASLYRLGIMTLRGQNGQPLDYAKGADLIHRSADCADENAPQGAYVYGMLLAYQLPQMQIPDGMIPFDEARARHYIEKAAFLKFSKAQLKMGSSYELAALGCQFDPALSLHYNRLASTQGEPEADMAISKWFLVGHEGLFPKSEEIAYCYANRAAYAGLSNAEFAMGYFSELGIYVPRNIEVALEWYKRAASNGNPDAQGRIDGISHKQVLSRTDHEKVALNRIRSQYGSQRGARPARFDSARPPPRMSAISEQLRQETPVPYPLDDRPPTVPPPSSSTPPYPMHGGPPVDYRPSTAQPDRPSTAFSISPEIRPSSTFTTASGRQRMSPAMALPGRGPPPSFDPRRPAMGQRVASTPASMQSRPTSAAPFAPAPPPKSSTISNALDIGYVAPQDMRRPSPRPPGDSNSGMQQPANRTPRPSSRPNLAPQVQAALPPKPAPVRAQPPPKKGPQTFEEMGVPATKQAGECVVM